MSIAAVVEPASEEINLPEPNPCQLFGDAVVIFVLILIFD
jgi:hypothetical protein